MEAIIRNVRDINASERQALEHVLGRPLQENQQVIVHIVTLKNQSEPQRPGEAVSAGKLPEWCDVFDGLSDDQVAEVEKVILHRAGLSRASE
jgi:hypothetical protein